MLENYQRPPSLDAISVELTYFCRKDNYAAILDEYIQERPDDLKGTQEKSTVRALRAAGMDRISAPECHRKILESYQRYKSCRTITEFKLPMAAMKAFTEQFKHSTFPRLRSYRQPVVSFQERAMRDSVPKGAYWKSSLNNDPFFCALLAPANMWVSRPNSGKIVDCRVLIPYLLLTDLKQFLSDHDGELITSRTIPA